MFEALVDALEEMIISIGPPAIFLAMFVETIFPPIPSEVVMPLGGYVAFVNGGSYAYDILSYFIIAGALGHTSGSLVLYMVARYGGRRAIVKYGKYFMFDGKKLTVVEKWFRKNGSWAVFLCKMAPGLREIICLPAGLAKMNVVKYLWITFFGALVWSGFLGSIGFFLADSWASLNIGSAMNALAIALLLAIISYFVLRFFKKSFGKKRRS
jgi:membrane protein DedA with SNARE-associated domain